MTRTELPESTDHFVKSPEAIATLRRAGQMLATTLETLMAAAQPGVTGIELDALARRTIKSLGGEPGFLGFEKYPATICFSVNEGMVHGLPTARRIEAGDVVKLDCGVVLDGWNTDSAVTLVVGEPTEEIARLVNGARASLEAGIATIRAGVHLGDVQHAIQTVIERHHLGLVRSLSGHGIGRSLHESPRIPNFGRSGEGLVIEAGMVICLEPMVTLGTGEVRTAADKWTVESTDGTLTAHIEHTILVTADGAEVLTRRPSEL